METPHRRPTRLAQWKRGGGFTAIALMVPTLVIFGMFSWFPIVRALVMSFQENNMVTEPKWVQWDNYTRVLSDPLLFVAARNTLYLTGLSVLLGFPLPIILAAMMAEVKRLRGVYTVLAYLPSIIPPVVAILLWKVFYDGSASGVFNTIAGWVGLGPYPWIQSQGMAMPALVVQGTWAGAGATTLIYLAALTSVPADLYDAAEIDGASLWRRIWHIMLPQIRPLMMLLLILQLIASFQAFLEPFIFTGGGPANATLTLMLQVYNYAFGSLGNGYGPATALSVLFAVVLGLLTILYFRVTKRWSE